MNNNYQEKPYVRVAVLVSGGGTNLQALIDAERAGALHSGRICLVVSDRNDAYALERARIAGIESAIVVWKDCPDAHTFEQRLHQLLEENRIDLIVLAGFMRILSPAFTSAYPRRILNIHPSLIPAFCGKGYYGLKVHEAALARGVKLTGATVHYVNEIPDGCRRPPQRYARNTPTARHAHGGMENIPPFCRARLPAYPAGDRQDRPNKRRRAKR